jgi:uncharacterized membrane protein
MKGWLLLGVAGVVLGLITHLATLIAVPVLAPAPAYARLVPHGAPNVFFPVAATGADRPIPFLDPKFRYLVCRFEMSGTPQHVHTPVGGTYTALSFYTPEGEPFFSVNDRSAVAGALDVVLRGPRLPPPASVDEGAAVVVESPRDRGLAVLRVLAAEPSDADAISAQLADASCDAPSMPPQPPAPVVEPDESLQILRMSPSSGAGAKVVPIPATPPARR